MYPANTLHYRPGTGIGKCARQRSQGGEQGKLGSCIGSAGFLGYKRGEGGRSHTHAQVLKAYNSRQYP